MTSTFNTSSSAGSPDNVLQRLESEIGPVALMSLQVRGLLSPIALTSPNAGVVSAGAPDRKRVVGALGGAAIGHACGYWHEWSAPPARVMPATDAPGAEIELMRACFELAHRAPLRPGAALGEFLVGAPRFHRRGNALPVVIHRLRAGTPWFEAGVGSFGSGAVTRGVGIALAYPDDQAMRAAAIACDTVVTHASVDAVSVNVAIGEVVTRLLRADRTSFDPKVVLDELVAGLAPGAGRDALIAAQAMLRRGAVPAAGAEATMALTAALVHAFDSPRSPQRAITRAVRAGGDTDTVGALVGAFVGALNGLDRFPPQWVAATPAIGACRAAVDAVSRPDASGGGSPVVADTHIHFLLDRSGSMQCVADDVIGGFNEFLAEQQADAADGDCRFTLVQFDSNDLFEVLHDAVPIVAVDQLDAQRYRPRGGTPLLDALGSLLDHAEHCLAAGTDHLVVVFTDGLENASRIWTREALFARVARLQKQGWTFVFLGANQDSYAEARGLGFHDGSVSDYDHSPYGMRMAMAQTSRAASRWRGESHSVRAELHADFFRGDKEAEKHLRRRRT